MSDEAFETMETVARDILISWRSLANGQTWDKADGKRLRDLGNRFEERIDALASQPTRTAEVLRDGQGVAAVGECGWAQDDDGVWFTDCANSFEITLGGPRANGFAFCCYCGNRLVECEREGA